MRRIATRLKSWPPRLLAGPGSLPAPHSLPPGSGREGALGALRRGNPTRGGVACMPALGATQRGDWGLLRRLLGKSSSSLPFRLALAPCGSRTHLTPLLQRPGWGCCHPPLSGARRRRPCGRDGESAECGPPEPPAPLPPPPLSPPPPPPRAWKAARDARCLVERPGRGLEPGRHWRPRPARRPRSPIGREQPRGAHLRPHTWGGPEVAALACAPGFGERS